MECDSLFNELEGRGTSILEISEERCELLSLGQVVGSLDDSLENRAHVIKEFKGATEVLAVSFSLCGSHVVRILEVLELNQEE